MTSFLDTLRENRTQQPVVEPFTMDLPEKSEPAPEIPMAINTKPETRIITRVMDSKVFGGNVELVFNLDKPDQATVDGVKYTHVELVDLLGRGISAVDLRAVHEIKRAFDGEVHNTMGLDNCEGY